MKVLDYTEWKASGRVTEREPDTHPELRYDFKSPEHYYLKAAYDGFTEALKIYRNIICAHPKATAEMKSLANRVCVDLTRECSTNFNRADNRDS